MEIKSLTGLRGVAAMIVLWFHVKAALISRGLQFDFPLLVDRLLFSGGHSVDVFFVLSGFILALTYQNWFGQEVTLASYWKYFRRRFARIYPLHFVLLAGTVVAVAAARWLDLKTNLGLDRFDFQTLPEHFLLVHAWGITMSNSGTWNPPTWSISIEILAYMVLPLLLLGFARIQQRYSWLLLMAMVAVGFALNAMTPWLDWGFGGIARGGSEFVLGCITARFMHSSVATQLRTNAGCWLSMVALLVACVAIEDTGFIVGLCTAPLILALCGDNALARFFAWKPVYFLGEISYSIYIGHFLYTLVIWRVINPDWMAQGVWQLAVGFVAVNLLVIALSTATYYLIEQPGRDWLSDKKKVKQSPAVAV